MLYRCASSCSARALRRVPPRWLPPSMPMGWSCLTEVIGLRLRPRGHAAHVVGVELASGESMTADLVVDAAGRRSRTSDWLSAAGARPLPSVSSDPNPRVGRLVDL